MQNNYKYINFPWAVVGIFENPHQPLWFHIPISHGGIWANSKHQSP